MTNYSKFRLNFNIIYQIITVLLVLILTFKCKLTHSHLPPVIRNDYSRWGNKGCPCVSEALCRPVTRKSHKIVIGYTQAGSHWRSYDFSLLTELVIIGDISAMDPQLLCAAHNESVQIHLSGSIPENLLTNATLRNKWIGDQIAMITNYNLDGYNFDIENVNKQNLSMQNLISNLVGTFSFALKQLHKSYQISYCISTNNKDYNLDSGWYKNLANSIDYFVVMAYDMSWIMEGPQCEPQSNSPVDKVIHSLQRYLDLGVPNSKLVTVLPWYGYLMECHNLTSDGKCISSCKQTCNQQICYGDIVNNYIQPNLANYTWEVKSQTPFAMIQLEESNTTAEIRFDDGMSLSVKSQVIRRGGYRGVGAFRLDCLYYDGTMDIYVKRMWNSLAVFIV